MKDWIMYSNAENLNFSPYFKEELSRQLYEIFEIRLGLNNFSDKYFFRLFIAADELRFFVQDYYVYTQISVIPPDSSSRHITIGWKSDSFDDKLKIRQELKKGDDIQFFLFTDFPEQELRSYIKTKKTAADNFDYHFSIDLFPDAIMTFEFKDDLNSRETAELERVIRKTLKKQFPDMYISNIENDNIINVSSM